MRVTVERSGGFGNFVMRATVDTVALHEEEAAILLPLIEELREELTAAPASVPDGFQYRVTIEEDDGRVVSGVVGESEAAERLLEVRGSR